MFACIQPSLNQKPINSSLFHPSLYSTSRKEVLKWEIQHCQELATPTMSYYCYHRLLSTWLLLLETITTPLYLLTSPLTQHPSFYLQLIPTHAFSHEHLNKLSVLYCFYKSTNLLKHSSALNIDRYFCVTLWLISISLLDRKFHQCRIYLCLLFSYYSLIYWFTSTSSGHSTVLMLYTSSANRSEWEWISLWSLHSKMSYSIQGLKATARILDF
jgi:hypothetical protein